mmetsp:Transcript_19147/g.22824  ORF Transcript_19147/g.22824 Transcript_19147/m.22824 type:complete len:393 (-) Transcript_19147:125-1303(-)
MSMDIDSSEAEYEIKPKRRVKRVPSISGGSAFFEIPDASVSPHGSQIQPSIALTRLNIMKRRAQENTALFAHERHNILNQLFPSRVEKVSNVNSSAKQVGSFSMGPLLPRGRINTEDMEDEGITHIRQTTSYRVMTNATYRWRHRWELIHPHGKFRNTWDVATLLLIIWVIIYVPFMVAFEVEVDLNVLEWHHVISFLVDAFFLIDIVLNFNTGVEIDGVVVMERLAIAKDYIKSWFIIDMISGVPIDIVILTTGDTSSSNSQFASIAKMGRMMRILKLARLFRIARVMRVVSRIENKVSTQEAVRTLWKFFAVVLVYCHLFSCGFYAIGLEFNDKDEWARGVSDSTTFAKYSTLCPCLSLSLFTRTVDLPCVFKYLRCPLSGTWHVFIGRS